MRCGAPASTTQIGRDRAVEIARQETKLDELKFTTDSIDAIQTTSQGRTVWRVTIKGRLPDQPPGLYETRIVEIDASTGTVVSVSMN